jgi:hypothetical protein
MNISAADVDRIERRYGALTRDPAGFLEREAVKKELQKRRQAFVDTHGLSCFKCGGTVCEWAAGGPRGSGYWVICSTCVRKPRTKGAA